MTFRVFRLVISVKFFLFKSFLPSTSFFLVQLFCHLVLFSQVCPDHVISRDSFFTDETIIASSDADAPSLMRFVNKLLRREIGDRLPFQSGFLSNP